MNSERNKMWRSKKEKSQLYMELARGLGETATTWKDRARIAKKALPAVRAWELDRFSKSLPKINLSTRVIKVNNPLSGETYYL